MIFTLWSKNVIQFPSLRQKIQAYQDNKRQTMTAPWNNRNILQFSALPKIERNPRKWTTGKIRSRWSGKYQFNPIKMRRPNTQHPGHTGVRIRQVWDKSPNTSKACNSFVLLCSCCEQGALHPSLQESDWSREDWDSDNNKAREQNNLLLDFSYPKPQTDQTTDIN